MQLAVHQRHLKLVLEIADGPEPSDDDRRTHLLCELRQQSIERLKGNAGVVAHRRAQHVQPLLHREEWLLANIYSYGDDEVIGQSEAPANQVFMALRQRIEGARVDRDMSHGAWKKVMAVSP